MLNLLKWILDELFTILRGCYQLNAALPYGRLFMVHPSLLFLNLLGWYCKHGLSPMCYSKASIEHLSNDHKDCPNQHTRIVISYAIKWGILLPIWQKVNENWSELPNGGKATVEQILAAEEINPKEQHSDSHSLESKYKS